MNVRDAKALQIALLETPTDLGSNALHDICGALNVLLTDVFALYVRTKNFHWQLSGPYFHDYQLPVDEQAEQIFATTDAIAERGFSGKPQGTSWSPDRVARAWHELMRRLGYTRYVSQGGDWGAIVSQVLAVQAPAGLLGIHTNMPGTVPPAVLKLLRNRDPAPSSFSDAEKAAFASLEYFYRKGFGYAANQATAQ